MILRAHLPFYEEILKLPGFLQDPILSFGVQGIDRNVPAPAGSNPLVPRLRRFLKAEGKVRRFTNAVKGKLRTSPPVPPGFQFNSLTELLRARGHSVTELDLFDDRAELRYDMNLPVPESEHRKYATFLDIGCLEHLFDTAQCLENCLRMVRLGGHYLLHTPINGYFGHGLHVFNPQGLIDCVDGNGFKVVYLKYSTYEGKPIADPSKARNVLIWMVARKERELDTFLCPQQKMWSSYYPPTT